MYNLDMLKGNGVPKKSTPILTVLITAAISVPLVFCVFSGIEYMSNQVQISFSSNMLEKIKEKVETVPYDERLDNRLNRELGVGLDAIEDIKKGIKRNLQWSFLLEEITSSMPENLAIAEMDVSRSVDKLRVPDPKKEGRKREVEIVWRTVKMTVFNLKAGRNNDDAQDYIERLNSSPLLRENMESAKIAMIRVEEFGEQMLPCYFVECVFRNGYKPEDSEV